MDTTLNLRTRSESGKGVARKLRRAGRVPGIIYGGGESPVPVSMEAHEALNLFQSISVENTILQLTLDDREAERALVREVQVHPFRTELLHVDFLRVQRGVAIEVHVPVHLAGIPEGVKLGGVLEQVLHDIVVKCLPSKIPPSIDLDVAELGPGEVVRVGDLEMPEDVVILSDPDLAVCAVVVARIAEEDEEVEEDEAAELEDEAAEETPGDDPGGDAD